MTNTTLEQLDLFKLLGLDHLTEEEKDKYVLELTDIALQAIIADDMPQFMTAEEIKRFNGLAEKEETQEEARELVYGKIPNFDELVKEKMLILKKELVRANVKERLDIAQTPEEKTKLQETLLAIEKDEWEKVAELVIGGDGIK